MTKRRLRAEVQSGRETRHRRRIRRAAIIDFGLERQKLRAERLSHDNRSRRILRAAFIN